MKNKTGWLLLCLLIVEFTISSCLVVPERRGYERRNHYHHHRFEGRHHRHGY